MIQPRPYKCPHPATRYLFVALYYVGGGALAVWGAITIARAL